MALLVNEQVKVECSAMEGSVFKVNVGKERWRGGLLVLMVLEVKRSKEEVEKF